MNFEVRSSNEECRSHRTSFSILHSNFELRNSFARPCRASLDLAQNLVDQLLQFFPRLEVRNLLGRHFHFLAGLGVAAGARFAAAEAEAAESAQLDFLSGPERKSS